MTNDELAVFRSDGIWQQSWPER